MSDDMTILLFLIFLVAIIVLGISIVVFIIKTRFKYGKYPFVVFGGFIPAVLIISAAAFGELFEGNMARVLLYVAVAVFFIAILVNIKKCITMGLGFGGVIMGILTQIVASIFFPVMLLGILGRFTKYGRRSKPSFQPQSDPRYL